MFFNMVEHRSVQFPSHFMLHITKALQFLRSDDIFIYGGMSSSAISLTLYAGTFFLHVDTVLSKHCLHSGWLGLQCLPQI